MGGGEGGVGGGAHFLVTSLSLSPALSLRHSCRQCGSSESLLSCAVGRSKIASPHQVSEISENARNNNDNTESLKKVFPRFPDWLTEMLRHSVLLAVAEHLACQSRNLGKPFLRDPFCFGLVCHLRQKC